MARLFFLVLFSTFSLKCPSWEGGPSLPSLDQVPAVTRSHCLIHESFFFLIYVPDAFWQKKKNRLKWHNCSLSIPLLPSDQIRHHSPLPVVWKGVRTVFSYSICENSDLFSVGFLKVQFSLAATLQFSVVFQRE